MSVCEKPIVYNILEMAGPWDLARYQDLIDGYFGQRNSHGGLRAPELMEAAVVLDLAERHRHAGDEQNARSALGFAKDNFMGFGGLSAVLDSFDPAVAIDWGSILLPHRAPQSPPAAEPPSTGEPPTKDCSET
jgi:hypothetical protein